VCMSHDEHYLFNACGMRMRSYREARVTHLDPLHVGGAPDDDVVVLVAGLQELVQVRPRQLLRPLRGRALRGRHRHVSCTGYKPARAQEEIGNLGRPRQLLRTLRCSALQLG